MLGQAVGKIQRTLSGTCHPGHDRRRKLTRIEPSHVSVLEPSLIAIWGGMGFLKGPDIQMQALTLSLPFLGLKELHCRQGSATNHW